MQLAAFEHLDSSSSAKSLLSCSSALSSLIAKLERQLEDSPPRNDVLTSRRPHALTPQ